MVTVIVDHTVGGPFPQPLFAKIEMGAAPSAVISASVLTFHGPPPLTGTAPGPAATGPVATTSQHLTGAVTVEKPSGVLLVTRSDLRLVDPPADLSISSPSTPGTYVWPSGQSDSFNGADLSWAGTGSITTTQGSFQAPYLGVRAADLQATLHNTAATVDIHGTGRAEQVYANGVPQLRVAGRVDIVSPVARLGRSDPNRAFSWEPRNLDKVYDMAILSIHPANAAARGVHLGLEPMPAMFGGEPHTPVGGDTTGLISGYPILSIVAPKDDYQRGIAYNAPPGTVLKLVLQGNFDPITVTFTVP